MSKITIYHNPRCRKSREGLEILKNSKSEIEIVEYLKQPLDKEELKAIVGKLNIRPIELIRKGEGIYKEHFKGKELSDDEWIEAMLEYPKLIERPIVVAGEKAVVGRPPEKINDLIA